MPWSPLILFTRSKDHLTSAEVMGEPSENLTPFLNAQVHVFRFADALQPVASTGWILAPCGKPYRPWNNGRSRVNESKSYSFAGSMLTTVPVVPSMRVVADALSAPLRAAPPTPAPITPMTIVTAAVRAPSRHLLVPRVIDSPFSMYAPARA